MSTHMIGTHYIVSGGEGSSFVIFPAATKLKPLIELVFRASYLEEIGVIKCRLDGCRGRKQLGQDGAKLPMALQ